MVSLQPALRGRIVGALSCQKDSYLQILETEVLSCIRSEPSADTHSAKSTKKNVKTANDTKSPAPPQYLIEFGDSVLFPEGKSTLSCGGQPSDHGTIMPLSEPSPEPIPINFVERQGLRCVTHSSVALPPGVRVLQKIDFPRRWDHMQQHTGQHLLSAIMEKHHDLKTIGWHMGTGENMNYVDVPRKPSEEEIQSIQEKCNEAIQQNLEITVSTPDNAKLDKMPADYDKENGVVRVISIGDLDTNTCCGTHLRQTSHIALLLLGSIQSVHETRCRLSFIAGDRAIGLATGAVQCVRSISKLLSSANSPSEVLSSVSTLKNNASMLKKEEAKLLADVANYEADRVKTDLGLGSNAFVHRAAPGLDFINTVAAIVKGSVQQGNLVVLASGEGKEGGHIVIVGDESVIKEFVVKLKDAFPGIKVGGKGAKWQGKVAEWRKGDLATLKQLVG